MRKTIAELKLGDGILTAYRQRAVVVHKAWDGVSVELERPDSYTNHRHVFVPGNEFEVDPQGAWSTNLHPHLCSNRRCCFWRDSLDDYTPCDPPMTALDYCWQCGAPEPQNEPPIPTPVFNEATLKYKKAHEMYQRWEHRPMHDKGNAIKEKYEAIANAKFKELFPRRKKINYNLLPEDYWKDLVAQAQAEQKAAWDLFKKHRERTKEILNQLAPTCELTPNPEMYKVDSSSSDAYRSQGYGACHYAKGALAPSRDLLIKHGFKAKIIMDKENSNEHSTVYNLMANLQPFQYDAFGRVTTVSMKEWIASQEAAGVNPRVYNPFLPFGSLSYERV